MSAPRRADLQSAETPELNVAQEKGLCQPLIDRCCGQNARAPAAVSSALHSAVAQRAFPRVCCCPASGNPRDTTKCICRTVFWTPKLRCSLRGWQPRGWAWLCARLALPSSRAGCPCSVLGRHLSLLPKCSIFRLRVEPRATLWEAF